MNKGALTLTMIFKAQGLNYGEGIGNISELKKITRGNGKQYSYASRQCLRYDISRLGAEWFGWNLHVVSKEKGTVQFKDECTIKDSVEMDLFGYMKTKKKKDSESGGSDIRSAKVRISPAISLEEYKSDIDFLTNMGLAKRLNEDPNLANIENHLSYYVYTITFDLNEIGIDKKNGANEKIEIPNSEKAKRVNEVLNIIKLLNRDIRGRRENLSPVFSIGGLYQIATPFFMGRVNIKWDKKNEMFKVKDELIKEALDLEFNDYKIGNDTNVYIDNGNFYDENIKELFNRKTLSLNEFFKDLQVKVNNFYGV